MAGEQIVVAPKPLNQNRDFPVLTEYHNMLGGIFQWMYSLDPGRLSQVFPERHCRRSRIDLRRRDQPIFSIPR